MSKEIDSIGYDEDDAVAFIRKFIPSDLSKKLSDNDIVYVIDIVYDFYEDKGLMNANLKDSDVIDIDEDELISFVLKNVKKDKICNLSEDEVSAIIKGELEYCDSLNMFE